MWDLSLVDPDNRRAVDFGYRRRLLDALLPTLFAVEAGRAEAARVGEILDQWHDGRVKLAVTAAGLRFRRDHPEVVLQGEYLPPRTEGTGEDHLVAFARRHSSGTLVAAVPGLAASLASPDSLPLGEAS
jgi:(1->4)-alpha-D-glucan 1-alpha-D-glucosylmutase